MTPLERQFGESIDYLEKIKPFNAEIGLILGSGLGDFADSLNPEVSISTSEIPGFPESTVAGHSGKLHFVELVGKRLILFQGRIHFYEGYSLRECLLPVELAFHAGARYLIITNAAGGINPNLKPGSLMLVTGFNSTNIKRELAEVLGPGALERRNRLIGFSQNRVNSALRAAALSTHQHLDEGTYFYTKGPNYETPAEIRFIAGTNGDAVGMSSVHEALYAEHIGIETGMVSCISNFAAGISPTKLNHAEVTETANLVKSKFGALLRETVKLIEK